MKSILLCLIITLSCFIANAQRDSILVVIECDSLYRPFLEHAGVVNMRFTQEGGYDEKAYDFKIGKQTTFNLPIPKKSDERYEMYIQVAEFPYFYFLSNIILFGRKNYTYTTYDERTGKPIHTDTFNYTAKSEMRIKLPVESEHNKYLIDNTCPTCSKNDSVSWIVYGGMVEDPLTGQIEFIPNPYNPYNNPICPVFYNPGCTPYEPHWYCNRCKKEY